MFEQPVGKAEKDRSRTIVLAGGIAVLVVIVLIVLVSWVATKTQQKIEVSAVGSPEFNSYATFLKLDVIDRKTGERLNNKYGRIRCVVQNTGDKTIIGLQLRGLALGFSGEILKEKIMTPIPNQKDALGPNQSIELDLYIEPAPDPAEISDMTVEISGLKLK